MSCAAWWAERAQAAAAAPLASDDERRRADRLARPADRQRSLLGSVLLRVAAADALGVAAGEVRLTRTCPRCGTSTAHDAHGRPGVAGTDGTGLGLSLAHAGEVVVVAVAGTAGVGVDVEPVRPVEASALADLLAPGETAPAPGADTTALWVRKESVLKATGAGLAVAPARVRLAPTARPGAWSARCDTDTDTDANADAGTDPVTGTTWDVATAPDHHASVTVLHRGPAPLEPPPVRRVRDVQFRP